MLQNLKKKVGGRAYHEEYKVILKSIREVLGAHIVPESGNKRRKAEYEEPKNEEEELEKHVHDF